MTATLTIDEIEARIHDCAPCPFCGDRPTIETSVLVQGDAALVCCVQMYEDARDTAKSVENVTIRWNTRCRS